METLEDIREIVVSSEKTVAVANFPLNLVGSNVDGLMRDVQTLQEKGIKDIVLDFKQSEYVNSRCLGSLVKVVDNLSNLGGSLSLLHMDPRIHTLFENLGLSHIFMWFDREEDALLYHARE